MERYSRYHAYAKSTTETHVLSESPRETRNPEGDPLRLPKRICMLVRNRDHNQHAVVYEMWMDQ